MLGRPLPTVARVIGCILLLVVACAGPSRAQTVDPDFWVTNGAVMTMERSGNTLYLGGTFSLVGPATGAFVRVAKSDGSIVEAWPDVFGDVRAVASDGAGGWFIGGQFVAVGRTPRANLAHVDALGKVTSWDPAANGAVEALWVEGPTVYVGGQFTLIGGQPRNYIAALNAGTGAVTGWNPNADGDVNEIQYDAGFVYAAGSFFNIGGQPRSSVAKLDQLSGAAAPWNPNPDGKVETMVVAEGFVYAGGDFSTIGGQVRSRIAHLNAVTGAATGWDPGADGNVQVLRKVGPTIYAGGSFSTIGGASRSRLAAIDSSSATATGWNPNCDQAVQDIVVDGPVVYVGGAFTQIGGNDRVHLAAVSASTGLVTPWTCHTNNTVNALGLDAGHVFAGGDFTSAASKVRKRIAAFDLDTGLPTAWDPGADLTVYDIAVQGNTVYVGGAFTSIGGQSRNHIAALDATTGLATAWNPNADGTVRSLDVLGQVFVGGLFSNIGGQSRGNLALLDPVTGSALGWNPNADGEVRVVRAVARADDRTIYVGGTFGNVGGQPRSNIAELDDTAGNVRTWNPGALGAVNAILASEQIVYVGGSFTTIGGQTRNRVAAFDPLSPTPLFWNPDADGEVWALEQDGDLMYIAGNFGAIGGQSRPSFAAVDASGGSATAWNPEASFGQGRTVLAHGNAVYAGGAFQGFGPVGQQFTHSGLATITASPTITAVMPLVLERGTTVTMTVTGSGLAPGTAFYLVPTSPDTINAVASVVRPDGLGAAARFVIPENATGEGGIVAITPDGQVAALEGILEFFDPSPYSLSVDIIGPSLVRPNRRYAYDIVMRNEGNQDVFSVPLWISGIPTGTTIEPDFDITPPPPGPGEPPWSLAPDGFDEAGNEYLTLVIPRLIPGINVRRIYLTVPNSVTSFDLDAALTGPWIGSAFYACVAGAGPVTNVACTEGALRGLDAYMAANSDLAAISGPGVWAKVAWNCEAAPSLPAALVASEQVLDFMLQAVRHTGAPAACTGPLGPRWQQSLTITVVTSVDPNIKIGASGVGPDHSIGLGEELPYSIRFENLETATAAAQEVIVTDFLPETVDPASATLSAITFGSRTITPPPGATSFATEVDLRPDQDLIVNLAVSVDRAFGVVAWSFRSIDPATGNPPDDPLAGFLPANVNPPEGEGSVLFSVRGWSWLTGGTSIDNYAVISFDGETLETPLWSNRVDSAWPDSHVLPLPATIDSTAFTVQWNASGPPPDLRDYSVYVSENGGLYRAWRENTTATADTFACHGGGTYAFYSVARDSSGNLEPAPFTADAQTTSTVGVDGPATFAFALDGAIPNPTAAGARIWFTLPDREPARLEVIDVSGRRVLGRDVGALGPGRHGVDVRSAATRPGVYLVRLRRGDQVRTTRMVVLR